MYCQVLVCWQFHLDSKYVNYVTRAHAFCVRVTVANPWVACDEGIPRYQRLLQHRIKLFYRSNKIMRMP